MKRFINTWEPIDFELEMTTRWSFPEHGNWATHDAQWRGNWSPYVARNLILRYSKVGDLLLDQFAGGGTTLIEAKLLARNIIGIDINDNALERCKEKTNFQCNYPNGRVYICKGDARNLFFLQDNTIDLICTHPPYANIIQYSKNTPGDLSLLSTSAFLKEMEKVAQESHRVLKPGKFCAILMGDMRQHGYIVPLSFKVMNTFLNTGFGLKEIIIKAQHNCHSTRFWKERIMEHNFLLIAHEYLFIFKKILCK